MLDHGKTPLTLLFERVSLKGPLNSEAVFGMF